MLCGAKCDLHVRLATVSRYLRRPSGHLFTQQLPGRPHTCLHRSAAAHTAAGTHVWWLASSQVPREQLGAYRSLLSAQECAHVDAAQEPHVAHERLLARALVRWVLSQYLPGTAPQQLQFTRNSNGKPHLVQRLPGTHSELHFNLSHTPDLLGVAVSAVGRVGLDVEVSRRAPSHDPMRLAVRRFTPQEVALLAGTPEGTQRSELFMQLWTLKEAFVKALGTGLSAAPALKGFSIGIQQHGPAGGSSPPHISHEGGGSPSKHLSLVCHYEDPHSYGLLLLQPGLSSQHVAALCLQLCDGSSLTDGLHVQGNSGVAGEVQACAGFAPGAPSEPPHQSYQPLESGGDSTGAHQRDGMLPHVPQLHPSSPHAVQVFHCVPMLGWETVEPQATQVLATGWRSLRLHPPA